MRRWALLAVIGLLATACDLSHVKPQQTIVISGQALHADGTPLRHADVHLYKEADFGEFLVGSALTLGTLGGVCLFPGAPAICHKGRVATTDAHGVYRFTMKGSDTQGVVGDASTLDVVFADPRGGPAPASTTLRFTVQVPHLHLPAARLWNAGLRVRSGRAVRMSWRAQPAGASYTVQLLAPGSGAPLWSQAAARTGASVDPRVLEDHAATAAVTARRQARNDVGAVFLSAGTPVHPSAGAPPTRHRPCSAVVGTTHLRSFQQTVCGLTDGDLTTPARLAANGKVVTGAVVDMGRTRRVRLVVARGVAGSVVIEVSTNGRSWRRVAVADAATVAVRPTGRPVARYVRVRSASGLDESMLAEISVW